MWTDFASSSEYVTISIDGTIVHTCHGLSDCKQAHGYQECVSNMIVNNYMSNVVNVSVIASSAVNICPTSEGNYVDVIIQLSCTQG